jgi:hypothetical protein
MEVKVDKAMTYENQLKDLVDLVLEAMSDPKYGIKTSFAVELTDVCGRTSDYHWGINPCGWDYDVCGKVVSMDGESCEGYGLYAHYTSHGSYNGSCSSFDRISRDGLYKDYAERGTELTEEEQADDRNTVVRMHMAKSFKAWCRYTERPQMLRTRYANAVTCCLKKLFVTRPYASFGIKVNKEFYCGADGSGYYTTFTIVSYDSRHKAEVTLNANYMVAGYSHAEWPTLK